MFSVVLVPPFSPCMSVPAENGEKPEGGWQCWDHIKWESKLFSMLTFRVLRWRGVFDSAAVHPKRSWWSLWFLNHKRLRLGCRLTLDPDLSLKRWPLLKAGSCEEHQGTSWWFYFCCLGAFWQYLLVCWYPPRTRNSSLPFTDSNAIYSVYFIYICVRGWIEKEFGLAKLNCPFHSSI